MAHSFTNLLYHIVFSTKERANHIDAELKPDLLAYLGGILREMKGRALIANGTADHVHLLAALPSTVAVADALRVLKTNSSLWVHKTRPMQARFAWQTGYGAFTVSQSQVETVKQYIANQEKHHHRMTFKEEFLALLKRHGIQYDECYIWE